jgi:hypothetical protein
MSARHLKSLIQAGHYKPDPGLVAEAMLERRGVRVLLAGVMDDAASSAVDRNRRASAFGRRAS